MTYAKTEARLAELVTNTHELRLGREFLREVERYQLPMPQVDRPGSHITFTFRNVKVEMSGSLLYPFTCITASQVFSANYAMIAVRYVNAAFYAA